jgi:5-methylcytosine-specific restriction endonuclease McrA
MHKQTKATNITPAVKREVMERDGGLCIVCGAPGDPVSHVVRRSQGGLGTVQNIVTHCHDCHFKFDNYDQHTRIATFRYIKEKYPGWTEDSVKYSKYGDTWKR